MDADGTNKKQLTFEPKGAGWGVPSPDGRYIVLVVIERVVWLFGE
jgi:Tol biopolymer transport system component